jgi:hypothetical protein
MFASEHFSVHSCSNALGLETKKLSGLCANSKEFKGGCCCFLMPSVFLCACVRERYYSPVCYLSYGLVNPQRSFSSQALLRVSSYYSKAMKKLKPHPIPAIRRNRLFRWAMMGVPLAMLRIATWRFFLPNCNPLALRGCLKMCFDGFMN